MQIRREEWPGWTCAWRKDGGLLDLPALCMVHSPGRCVCDAVHGDGAVWMCMSVLHRGVHDPRNQQSGRLMFRKHESNPADALQTWHEPRSSRCSFRQLISGLSTLSPLSSLSF